MIPLACLLILAAPPAADPALAAAATDGLSRAADCLDRGDYVGAVPHLAAHVRAYPEQVMVRAYLAELLFKLRRFNEAAKEFERFIADAQPMTGPPKRHLVHCHTRLMTIAEAKGDVFTENLNRGIGLILLVQQWDADPQQRDEAMAAETAKKAADALRSALITRPTDARANLYLADVYLRLGQTGSAMTALRAAKAGIPLGLTPDEAERLAQWLFHR
jgi:thioredoxin-like negative regulator of GroEL